MLPAQSERLDSMFLLQKPGPRPSGASGISTIR